MLMTVLEQTKKGEKEAALFSRRVKEGLAERVVLEERSEGAETTPQRPLHAVCFGIGTVDFLSLPSPQFSEVFTCFLVSQKDH